MSIKLSKTENGDDIIIMTRDDFQELIDSRDHAVAMRNIATGTMPLISNADMDAYLDAPTPLAFWRKHRKWTSADLAKAVEITQPYLSQLENGRRTAAVAVYARLARQLGVRMEDLVEV